RNVAAVDGDQVGEFVGDLLRHVATPTFGNIESDHLNRVRMLSSEEIADDSLMESGCHNQMMTLATRNHKASGQANAPKCDAFAPALMVRIFDPKRQRHVDLYRCPECHALIWVIETPARQR